MTDKKTKSFTNYSIKLVENGFLLEAYEYGGWGDRPTEFVFTNYNDLVAFLSNNPLERKNND